MKGFADLTFKAHRRTIAKIENRKLRGDFKDSLQAKMDFDNGWAISVIAGSLGAGGVGLDDDSIAYGVAVFKNGQMQTDESKDRLRPWQVHDLMVELQGR